MNAVEIESAISDLALQPFAAAEFPFAFLAAFGNKDTTLKRLRSGNNNASDVTGGVLQRNNIHIAVCEAGAVGDTLKTLRESPATTKAKAKFILATDGQTLEAEELTSGETIACTYQDFPNHFGFFLPLAGISTIKEIRDNPIDVRATARLNKLYVELLNENPAWAKDERRADMNHFMARLVFCFFAEDTDIFNGDGLFTHTVEQMSERDGSNTHEVIGEIFRAMNTKVADRATAVNPSPSEKAAATLNPSPSEKAAATLNPSPSGRGAGVRVLELQATEQSQSPSPNSGETTSHATKPASGQVAGYVEGPCATLGFDKLSPNGTDTSPSQPRLPNWANGFPYVNGGLFSGSVETPRFTRMARTYLTHAGNLNWKQINPDIFGSMIQAVADDEERGALGMHYTSVPNILKVLNPLFLDELRAALAEADDNKIKLLNLRKRMARIRVFDPACGSGNFLVIAYKQMREIEAEINRRRGESHLGSEIPLTNFRGIELRDFPAEIARLALIIAEFQCDVLYRGQKDALLEFLPLSKENWIVCGNALRLDWLSICPPTGTGVKLVADDLFGLLPVGRDSSRQSTDTDVGMNPDLPDGGGRRSDVGRASARQFSEVGMNPDLQNQAIDFANEGGETFICGNPPYLGSTWQSAAQKDDLKAIFDHRTKNWKSLDYVAGWFMKAADYGTKTQAAAAFVSTNSICQGQQVPILWPLIFGTGNRIVFAHTSFKWANLASHNAGVTVAIVGLSSQAKTSCRLYSVADSQSDAMDVKEVAHINAYLVASVNVVVDKASRSLSEQAEMSFGNKPVDGGHLLLSSDEVAALGLTPDQRARFIRRIYGSAEFIRGLERYCLWITDAHLEEAMSIPAFAQRIEGVRAMRLASRDSGAKQMAARAHQMREMNIGLRQTIVMPCVSSESRGYLPVGLVDQNSTVTNLAFALYDAPLWNMALIASRLHLVWIGTVCGKLETRYRYSNTLGWNTFPVPLLTEQNKADLTACAEAILLAREAHFPATIADLYDPDTMPDNLRHAHERNDEVLERIYIGRRFKNDTERLEKLFELYTKMTAVVGRDSSRQRKNK